MSARDTALSESAQAIFCSMADYLGVSEDKVKELWKMIDANAPTDASPF